MKRKAGLGIGMLALILSSCSGEAGNGGGDWKPFAKDEQATIKIMYWSEKQFFDDYGLLFQSEFPNVEIEVASTTGIGSDPSVPVIQAYEDFIKQNNPDVLFLSNHKPFVEKGMLLELDPLIEQHKFDLDEYLPAVLSMLRREGDGKIYALSPNFMNFGIYYNVDLFRKYNVEPPSDPLTWKEIFELAKRFPSDGSEKDRIYGFTIDGFSSPFFQILYSLSDQNRKLLNSDATEVQLNNDTWKKSFEEIVSAVQSGAFYLPTEEEIAKPMRTAEDNRFLMGKSAMTYNSDYFINQLSTSMINWGIAPAPVDPFNRTQSSSYALGPSFGINKESRNTRAAWEFVKYVNSEEFAQIKSKSSREILFSRTAFIRPQGDRDISALYRQEPIEYTENEFSSYDVGVKAKVISVIVKELTAVVGHSKTLDEAIKTMEEEGDSVLLQARSKE